MGVLARVGVAPLLALSLTAGLAACDDATPSGTTGTEDAGSRSDTGSSGECTPNATAFCTCSDGSSGVQTCSARSVWGDCDCGVVIGPDAGTDTGTTDTGTTDTGTTDTGVTDTGTTDTGTPDTGTPDTGVPEPTCGPEGVRYASDRWEEDMYPGGMCIDCHTNERRERPPIYTFAGTVFPYYGYREGCGGTPNATIEITGADGATLTLRTGATGNFFTQRSVALPYTAKVILGGAEIPMLTPQTDGDCNSCHSETGSNDALGRIIAP